MPALGAGIHVFFIATRRGWHLNSGLPELRTIERRKSGKPAMPPAPQGFLLSGGIFTMLDDPLATPGTEAFGIEDAGQIVGFCGDASGTHGFLVSGGTWRMRCMFPNESGTPRHKLDRGKPADAALLLWASVSCRKFSRWRPTDDLQRHAGHAPRSVSRVGVGISRKPKITSMYLSHDASCESGK
jgi:hypothetical protein